MRERYRFPLALFCIAALLSACGKGTASLTLPTLPGTGFGNTGGKIQHVVFIVQENRTFDNMFGGPNPFPGADAVPTGKTSNGTFVPLDKIELECTDLIVTNCPDEDPNNFHQNFLTACDPVAGPPFVTGTQPAPCRMDGFDKNQTSQFVPGLVYSYLDYAETKPYWDIAKAYALGDRFFMSHNSESYVAHQYIFSGQSNNVVDEPEFPTQPDAATQFLIPWGCDSPAGTTTLTLNPTTGQETPSATGPFPCFGYKSLADLAQSARVGWRLYSYSICQNINALDVNQSIRYGVTLWPQVDMQGCPFLDNVSTDHFRTPESSVLSDVQNGDLPAISWVLPGPVTSDHPGVPAGYCGPWWVAKVVDAIGKSKYWNSTAIFIFWDDWGGFYDHVPPYVVRDQAGPGFRVPFMVVSPYAKRGYVSHSPGEFGTLLNFTEDAFHLGSLNTTDASPYVGNLDDYFDFNNPQPFTNIALPSYLLCNYGAQAHNRLAPATSRWLKMIHDDE